MGVTGFFGGMIGFFKAAIVAPLTEGFKLVMNYAGSGDIAASYGDHKIGRALAAPAL